MILRAPELLRMQEYPAELFSLPAVVCNPLLRRRRVAALFVAAKYFKDKGETHRLKVLVPMRHTGPIPPRPLWPY
ncbi:MAG: hypothetical protein U0798_04695 [Gemmataceae bacterium]